ncbi:MAG TPA: winged helix DNA-binding domain-containing protein [Actinoplanes sp.]|nr:winged helix DNA-binding domain-containing protein [Actinoplanes sp.]
MQNPLGARLASLLLRPHPGGRPDTVAGVVSWFGAMQAQDMASALWSLGVRLPGSTVDDVNAALERREVIRTWPMRGTVHLVPAADARWMLDLMGVRMLAAAAVRRKSVGLTEADAERAVDLLAAALAGGRRLTRAECMAVLDAGGIAPAGQRGYHLLWYASQRGVTAIAPHVGKEQTFVLLDEWAPEPRTPSREEALALMATWYFRAHGPATVADLARWTGLTITDCRAGVAAAGPALAADGRMIVDPLLLGADLPDIDDWLALPGFDEYMLGYKDRSMMLDEAHKQAIVPGGNGVFQATLVRGGRVVGIWKRTLTKKAVVVAAQPLLPFGAADRKNAEAALLPYADFIGRSLEVRWP